jgi:hypothetical protein
LLLAVRGYEKACVRGRCKCDCAYDPEVNDHQDSEVGACLTREYKMKKADVFGFTMIVVVFGFVFGMAIQDYGWRRACIERNVIEYRLDPKSGIVQFYWLTKSKDNTTTHNQPQASKTAD